MKSFDVDKFNGKMSVVTGFFNDPDYVLENTKEHDLCILLGGMARTGSTADMQLKTALARTLSEKYVYVYSYKDLMYADVCGFNPEAFETIQWLKEKYISATVTFSTMTKYTIVGGAVLPTIKNWEKQKTEITLAHERDDINWAAEYNGRFGFVISSENYSDTIKYNQHCCLVGHQDKPIILNVNERGVEEFLNGEL